MRKLRAMIRTFKRYGDMIKPFDIIIIVALIILSFTPLAIFSYQQKQQADRAALVAKKQKKTKQQATYTAVVSHDGTVLKRVNITKLKRTTTFTYRDSHGHYNTITFAPKRVAITKANCSDQVCVRRGWIHKPGQTIVCLPHKLLVEIKSSNGHVKSGGNGLVTE
ncbi:NusG domain II-containing protein [Lactiplantibacillus pentosus]|uniref:NusG domain II-containing protein n=1 Tax=Lactiplantibacillus pentosus TaxID=1589 RepID=UPI0020795FC5|nr:NusG domain II-containing protein [Lactiplantibacillus pentosus]MCS8603394.1 NusG domain II-containing protein [Lactiplantibacillus pentosus]USJ87213.1 NusG domain II-containing protein [Lactiplantibacillus pentosus]